MHEKNMLKHLVIADDFTGACEIGEKYEKKGLAVEVSLSYCPSHKGTLVVDTETRNATEPLAAAKTEALLSQIDFSAYERVVKKIDSTLRGNIGVELALLTKKYSPDLVLFLPAYPAMGRTVERGILKVHGQPLLQTEFAKDPIKPVTEERIGAFLEPYFPGQVSSLTVESIFAVLSSCPKGIVLYPDCVSQQELEGLLRQLQTYQKRILYVGTAAMVEALLSLEEIPSWEETQECFSVSSIAAVGLVASLSEKTRQQLLAAKEKGITVLPIEMKGVWEVAENPAIEEAVFRVLVEQVRPILENNQDILLVSKGSLEREAFEADLQWAKKQCIPKEDLSRAMKLFLGKIGKRLYQAFPLSGFLLTGGDTAVGLLEQMEIGSVKVQGAVESGIPILQVTGGPFKDLRLVTKAGGFGTKDSIWKSLDRLKGVSSSLSEQNNRK